VRASTADQRFDLKATAALLPLASRQKRPLIVVGAQGSRGLSVPRGLFGLLLTVTVGSTDRRAKEVLVGVLVLLEMDGSPEAVLAAAVDLDARRPTSAKLAQAVAPTESGVVVATFWESAEARDAYQSEPEHREALQASGLLDSVTEMRSRVFEDAELKLV
jgi:hypothetical protein